MNSLSSPLLLAPEVILVVSACIALFLDGKDGKGRVAAWLGVAAATVAAVLALAGPTRGLMFNGMLYFGGYTAAARAAIAGLTAVWCLAVAGRGLPGRTAPGVALALFSAAGGLLLVCSADLVTFFLAVEISTMPAYVLMGYQLDSERSIEGALKYFLLSVLTSLVMLYGLSFLFGLTGSTSYLVIAQSGSLTWPLGLVAALLVLVGLFAKLSAAPFHFWAPDAYAGAPAITAAFVSTVPKIAGLAALVRLYVVLSTSMGADKLSIIAIVAAVLSMLVGNLAAYPQTDLRRLMAYSGIAHSGYLLVGVAASNSTGLTSAVFYAIAYTAPTLGFMIAVSEAGPRMADFAGMAKRVPWLAWAVTLLLLSLIGVPPLAGFFGKLFLFGSALAAHQVVLVVFALVMSVVSAGYYFRIIKAMFFDAAAVAEDVSVGEAEPLKLGWQATTAIALTVVATVVIGLAASPILGSLLAR